jgi:hypothetical protein
MNAGDFIKGRKPTAHILFIVAGLQFALGVLYGWFYWPGLLSSRGAGWIFVFSGPIYLVLALSAKLIRCFALIIGFAFYLYLTACVHPVPSESGVWQDGLILKLPILAFLLWGLLVTANPEPDKRRKSLLIAVLIILCGVGIEISVYQLISLNETLTGLQNGLLYSASHWQPGKRMSDFVNFFSKINSENMRKATELGSILGICALGLCLLFALLLIETIAHRRHVRAFSTERP